MTEAFSRKIQWCWKFFQLLLTIITGALFWSLGEWKSFVFSDSQVICITVFQIATLLAVLIRLTAILSGVSCIQSSLELMVVVAIKCTIWWTLAAMIELRAYYYNFSKEAEESMIGEIQVSEIYQLIPELEGLKSKLLALGFITATKAILFLVEVFAVCFMINSHSPAQDGYVIQSL